jgi:hypothetical protein
MPGTLTVVIGNQCQFPATIYQTVFRFPDIYQLSLLDLFPYNQARPVSSSSPSSFIPLSLLALAFASILEFCSVIIIFEGGDKKGREKENFMSRRLAFSFLLSEFFFHQ